ncbi:MAG: hypothetical protein ACXW5W_01560 [Candidatus Binatia bacterium]
MTAVTEGQEVDTEELVAEACVDAMKDVTPPSERPERHSPRHSLPWIGDLANPRLGPLVVLNDSGYLVPLWTAGDLLRGCKYFWHGWRD